MTAPIAQSAPRVKHSPSVRPFPPIREQRSFRSFGGKLGHANLVGEPDSLPLCQSVRVNANNLDRIEGNRKKVSRRFHDKMVGWQCTLEALEGFYHFVMVLTPHRRSCPSFYIALMPLMMVLLSSGVVDAGAGLQRVDDERDHQYQGPAHRRHTRPGIGQVRLLINFSKSNP